MASSGRRMATDGSGTQHEEDKGFAENSALKEEHDPLFVGSYDLRAWLHGKLVRNCSSVLGRQILESSLELLSRIALALHGYGRVEGVEDADRALVELRVRIRLAESVGLLDRRGLFPIVRQS